jgi:hypothetical protein
MPEACAAVVPAPQILWDDASRQYILPYKHLTKLGEVRTGERPLALAQLRGVCARMEGRSMWSSTYPMFVQDNLACLTCAADQPAAEPSS